MKKLILLVIAGGLGLSGVEPRRVSLSGDWKFAADYQDWGERYKWFDALYGDGVWDHVMVPHVWSMDARTPAYIGAGWYRMRFASPPPPARGQHLRLEFEGVAARAKVWLNGKLLGEHEGGYTPFEFDIGYAVRYDQPNVLVVRADNRWNEHTLPGASPGPNPHSQLKAWFDDGGIVRDVWLVVTPPVYIVRQKIEATPEEVRIRAWVRNASDRDAPVNVSAEIWRETEKLAMAPSPATATVKAGATAAVDLRYALRPEQVSVWGLDTPVLYKAQTRIAGGASDTATFGIRTFTVKGTELLLNGKPVRLAGANRIPSHAEWGQNDPLEGAAQDMKLMKEAGLVMARMSHYPLSRAVLEWGDRHGMLFVEEGGNAGLDAEQLASPEMQRKFRDVQREMIERDWNHPSVVAWSVGNEFGSETPAGVKWVREMRDFCRALDPTRLITFATNRTAEKGRPEEEGSYHVDFVSMNTYSDAAGNGQNIDRMHGRYPDKPLVVSEFGMRADFVADETEREEWFRAMVEEIRKRPFLSGASVWSFNDYRSRYVGTGLNGYRPWGLADEKRDLRGSYHVLRREFSGFTVKEAQLKSGVVTVRLAARADFPVFAPAAAEIRLRMVDGQGRLLEVKTQAVAALEPGAERVFQIPATPGAGGFRGEVWRNGFRTLTFGSVRP